MSHIETDIVIRYQPETAIYLNSDSDVVIWQVGNQFEDNKAIVVNRNNLPDVITKLSTFLGEPVSKEGA